MSSFRWGSISAAIAFIVSMGLGIVSGVGAFYVILRAIIFAAVFFGLGFGLRFVINSFFPELLILGEESTTDVTYEQPGTQVNITLDSIGEYAVPELYKTPGDPQELGNIEDLISGHFKPRSTSEEGIDRKKEEGYNNIGAEIGPPEEETYEKTPEPRPAFTPSFGDDSTGLGGLPDLDAMAMAFSNAGESRPAPRDYPAKEAEAFSFADDDVFGSNVDLASAGSGMQEFQPQQTEDLEQVRSHFTGNKPQPLQGDFDAKELAQGIRTVLSKD